MDILTEQAETYDLCMSKITNKFGPNVQILRQKKIKMGGFLGFFERDGIELNFTLSREPGRFQASPAPARDFDEERKRILNQAAKASPVIAQRVQGHIDSISDRQRENAAAGMASQSLRHAQAGPAFAGSTAAGAQAGQIDAILKAVRNLESKIDKTTVPDDMPSGEHETIVKIENLLELNDFSPSYIKKMIARAKAEFSLDALADFDRVQDTVLEWIGESISIAEIDNAVSPRVILLVGPTGVGKTTTVAKIAASYSLGAVKKLGPRRVHVISIDNYRIGAKEQIEKYCGLMKVPFSYVEETADFRELMDTYRDVDIIVIDTIGKSPRDYEKIAEMRKLLDSAGKISDIHLAMSATTKASDMREIMQQYETFGYMSVIVTKLDETAHVGNIISVMDERKKSLAYVTTGQRVPNDFERASTVRFLTNLEGFRVNRAKVDEAFPRGEEVFEWRK
jgi:flagellar biosynthesis protein FlhF